MNMQESLGLAQCHQCRVPQLHRAAVPQLNHKRPSTHILLARCAALLGNIAQRMSYTRPHNCCHTTLKSSGAEEEEG